MRFLNRRRILIAVGATLIAFLALIAVIAAYLGSAAFHLRARQYMAEQIARRTGAQVTLADFHWSLWHEAFILEGLTLRGLEPAEEAPLAHFDRIQVGIHLRTLLERRIDLSAGDPKAYDDRVARLRLRQAFGRLIRRASDRGVFVLLDRQTPARLLSAFPAGVVVRRVGLSQAVMETRDFLAQPALPG